MAKSASSLSNWTLASYGAPAMPLSMVSLPLAVYLRPSTRTATASV